MTLPAPLPLGKPVEPHYTGTNANGVKTLVILPTGTGRMKAYVSGNFASAVATFGYRSLATSAFVPFSTLTPTAAAAEVFLEPGPGVQVAVSIAGATAPTDIVIALSAGY